MPWIASLLSKQDSYEFMNTGQGAQSLDAPPAVKHFINCQPSVMRQEQTLFQPCIASMQPVGFLSAP
jgi:hypothetical protein